MKKALFIVLFSASTLFAWSTVAKPDIYTAQQSDGTVLSYQLIGDEYFHYYATTDGYAIERKQGSFVYEGTQTIAHDITLRNLAEQDVVRMLPKGKVMPAAAAQARKAAQQQNQVMADYPLTGSPKSIVILVNFKDVKFIKTLNNFKDLLNKKGYSDNNAIGSCLDYFEASSNGVFSPQFDVYGPYELENDAYYYGGKEGHAHAEEMIIEACERCNDAGVDFSQYDTNKDGRIDNVFVYYAGHNAAEHAEGTVWPHRSIITEEVYLDGVKLYDYACTSELKGSSGTSMCGIGTFCHEFGHVLGLADLYDTDESSTYTVGEWDIMCSGNYNGDGATPPSYTSVERFQLGWLTPVQLTNPGQYELMPLETDNNAYLIAANKHNMSWANASPSEYFLLENRQRVGWDKASTCLVGTGMLVWHIDYSAYAWANNSPNNEIPMRCHLEEANGRKGISTANDPYPGGRDITYCDPTLHNGTSLAQPLLKIAEADETISFTFINDGVQRFFFTPDTLEVIESTYNPDTKKAKTPSYPVAIKGESLDVEQQVEFKTSSSFQISFDNLSWGTTLQLDVKADSTIDTLIYVRYNPKKMICEVKSTTLQVSCGEVRQYYPLRGTSPRPTLITTPEIIQKSIDITPYSVKVYWKPQEDAENYFVNFYQIVDSVETTTQSFENFGTLNGIIEAGWEANFVRTTSIVKAEGNVSVLFMNTDEYLMTPQHVQPVTHLSFWLSTLATDDDEVGELLVEGYNGQSWKKIESINIKRTTKKYTYSKDLDKALGYIQFRLTYTKKGGGGTGLDIFSGTCDKKVKYIFYGRDKTIEAMNEAEDPGEYAVFYINELTPNTDYYVQVQSQEDKGCEEHVSKWSQAQLLRTLDGTDIDDVHMTFAIDSIHYDWNQHVVYIPNADVAAYLLIYDTNGHLTLTIRTEPGENRIPLPVEKFQEKQVYIVKYAPDEKLKRKNKWVKIIF